MLVRLHVCTCVSSICAYMCIYTNTYIRHIYACLALAHASLASLACLYQEQASERERMRRERKGWCSLAREWTSARYSVHRSSLLCRHVARSIIKELGRARARSYVLGRARCRVLASWASKTSLYVLGRARWRVVACWLLVAATRCNKLVAATSSAEYIAASSCSAEFLYD